MARLAQFQRKRPCRSRDFCQRKFVFHSNYEDEAFNFVTGCEFISGWIASMTGLIIGHPIDTIKVRQQATSDKGIITNVLSTIHKEGFKGFYKGITAPLLTTGFANAIFFGTYGNVLQRFTGGTSQRYCCEKDQPHWHLKVLFAAGLGGLLSVFVSCPVELVKTRQQVDRKNEFEMFSSMAKRVYQTAGLKALYKGFTPTILRDSPSYAIYALTYEHFMCKFNVNSSPASPEDGPSWLKLISGGLAGVSSWVFAMPFDVVKSRLQADDLKNPVYKSMTDCFRQTYAKDGLRFFFKGTALVIVRSFPVNAVTFYFYDLTLRSCETYPSSK